MQNADKSTKEWVRLRKKLLKQVKAQVTSLLGDESASFLSYRNEYDAEFRRKWTISEKSELVSSILNADIVLLGDFHALQQSQRSHLRILKSLFENRGNLWIGMECFSPEDDPNLRKFLQGNLNEKKFLQLVKWETRWGFPWEHYRSILLWAKKHKIEVFGVNHLDSSVLAHSMKRRDLKTADILVRKKKDLGESLGVVIFGDLHLAEKHLPQKIKTHKLGQGLKVARVFQNSERIYFKLALLKKENKVDLVKFNAFDFCIFSVPPWVQWQNYQLFLEKNYDREIEDSDEDDHEPIDFTDHVLHQIQFVAESLGTAIDCSRLSVYTAGDPDFFEKIELDLKRAEILTVKMLIDLERSFYLPKLQIGYLGRLSVNHTSSLSMEYIHSQLSHREAIGLQKPNDFIREIWIQAVNYLGSKIINHKRKTDNLEDIKSSLRFHDHHEDRGKQALLLAVQQKIKEGTFLTVGRKDYVQFKGRQRSSYLEAARLLGGMMGERLYNSFHKGQIRPLILVKLLKTPVDGDDFEQFYFEMLEFIESLPTFKSKKERL